jgi:hypothetical protein
MRTTDTWSPFSSFHAFERRQLCELRELLAERSDSVGVEP